jgi:hypothetical protein
MITAMVIAITLSDCPKVKPGFEWLLGISCAGQMHGGSGFPTLQSTPSPSPPSPPSGGNPGGGDPGGPGNSGGHGHGKGHGKNK